MAKLTDDQQKQLDELIAMRDAPDDEDFEIEIRNGDKSARIPYHKGRRYLQQHFGIDLDEPPADDTGEPGDDTADDTGKPKSRNADRVSNRYFGKQAS